MADVFISYSRANQEVVHRLAEAVKKQGYSVWWDDELPPHRSYSEVITEKIGEAKAAIVVWSGGSIGSEWVRAEADLARNQKKLIQTAIDDCMPPMPFNQIQFASLADWNGEDDHPGWNKVKGSLAALCGAGSDPRTPYPMPDSPQAPAPPAPVTVRVPAPVGPAPRRSNVVLGALIGGSIVVIAGVGVLALTRGGGGPPAATQAVAQPPVGNDAKLAAPEPEALPPPATPAPRPAVSAPRPAVARTQAPTPRQAAARQPQQVQAGQMPQRQAAIRRYCMSHMAECMQMRRGRRAY
jgi:hypothetical protein